MIQPILFLVFSLFLILMSAEFFTNGVESFGRRLSLSQAVVGSILAAIGTALPETILPLVAILLHGGDTARKIGVGAILGAPFMLSTLAFFVVGVAVLAGMLRKKRKFVLYVDVACVRRDLLFFTVMYSSAIISSFLVPQAHFVTAALLAFGYVLYVYATFKAESTDILHADQLHFEKLIADGRRLLGLRLKSARPEPYKTTSLALICAQISASLVIMIGGAHIFVGSLEKLSAFWGMSPLLFALLVAPVATELPEKFNSITWTLKGRDTLALGNITGAMVFQSTFPVSVGLLFTDWNIPGLALFSAVLALSSAVIVLANIQIGRKISPATMLFGGVIYCIFAVAVVMYK
ncbi:MAG: sodium:calcium antiporter [Nitrospirae bacterium]|nr:sodium:calcium antiporter [Nitrospirota bacterium]